MSSSARFVLKSATSLDHRTVDDLFSRFDLTGAGGYGDFLCANAAVFPPMETALERAGVPDLVADWPRRVRSPALDRDLAALGRARPAPAPVPDIQDEAQVLGALYVLEGSRLGGALLARAVPSGLPLAFLSPGNPSAWRAFVSVLDQRLSSPEALRSATATARAVFAAFATSARRLLGTDHA